MALLWSFYCRWTVVDFFFYIDRVIILFLVANLFDLCSRTQGLEEAFGVYIVWLTNFNAKAPARAEVRNSFRITTNLLVSKFQNHAGKKNTSTASKIFTPITIPSDLRDHKSFLIKQRTQIQRIEESQFLFFFFFKSSDGINNLFTIPQRRIPFTVKIFV